MITMNEEKMTARSGQGEVMKRKKEEMRYCEWIEWVYWEGEEKRIFLAPKKMANPGHWP